MTAATHQRRFVGPLRSLLYVPACNARALEKARELPCDGLILDLEDAVLPEAKEEARHNLRAALKVGSYAPRTVLIRINRFDTPWNGPDKKLVAEVNPDGVVLPKVESADEVKSAERALFHAGVSDRTRIWAMIESSRGVLNAAAIAGSSPRLAGLIMGANDLANNLHVAITDDRLALLYSLSQVVVAARAHHLSVIDGVYGNLASEAGFAAACAQGVQLGFDGKTVIHPDTIAEANRAFAPSPEAIKFAEKVEEAWTTQQHKGVVVVDGQMIEDLHVRMAQRILRLHAAIAAREGK